MIGEEVAFIYLFIYSIKQFCAQLRHSLQWSTVLSQAFT